MISVNGEVEKKPLNSSVNVLNNVYNHNLITSDLSWSTVNGYLQNNVVVNDGENVSLNNIEESVSENIVFFYHACNCLILYQAVHIKFQLQLI